MVLRKLKKRRKELLKLKLLMVILFTPVTLFNASAVAQNQIDLDKFEKPFCMVGYGSSDLEFTKKLDIVKRYQRKIKVESKYFRKNKKLERLGKLHGSAKWVVNAYLSNRDFNKAEIDFAYFALTLFSEARNEGKEGLEMVARVINKRRRHNSYESTVTELAQFSAWYYKNQKDNVNLLCPNSNFVKLWKQTIEIAQDQFLKQDDYLNSTHYFAPKNMRPKYRIPSWAKGKKAVKIGNHIFLVKEKSEHLDAKLFNIPENAKKIVIKEESAGTKFYF